MLTHRQRLTTLHRRRVAAIAIGFAALVCVGYLVPWTWTGFRGNTGLANVAG